MTFRFVFLADTQLGCYATFSGFTDEQVSAYQAMGMTVAAVPRVEGYEWDARRYRRAVEVINALRPEFVLIGGDMVDDANSEDQIDEFMRITSGVDSAVDIHWVPGNHDIAPDATAPTGESIEAYRQVFGPDHYSFTHGDTLFIALNTPVIDHPENVPDEWERQRGFLEQELGRVGTGGVERAVLVGHHPLFVASPDEPDTYWNLPAERRSVILELAHGAGVKLGLAGHWHRNATATDGDFVQIVSGPVGFPLGTDPSGYRVVEVNRGGIDHHYHPLS